MSDAKVQRARADKEAHAPAPSPEAPPEVAQVAMEALTITISSTGRPIQLVFPMDMSEPELLEVIGWMATGLRAHLGARRMKTAGGRILLPGRH